MIYKTRIVDDMLKIKLLSKGACLIEGPKWCGKTTTALQQAKSVLRMDNPLNRETYIETSQIKPSLLLKGETPRLIDEWQLAPRLWDAIRYEIDQRGEEGLFILTGSSTGTNSNEITHSGTGRFSWLKMRTMSLYESGESSGEVSLKKLFEQDYAIEGVNHLTFDDLAFLTCRGGWPHSISMNKDIALLQAYDYYDGVIKSDVNKVDGISKKEDKIKLLMRSYARNIGSQVSYSIIKEDMNINNQNELGENTLSTYISALKRIYVIEDLPAWNPNLRSKTAIRTTDTRYFSDPSIAVASLGIGPEDLANDIKTFGLLFECLCIRDLRVYAESINGELYHYRDKNGLECDAVVHLRNGQYGLIEIKLGGDKAIEDASLTLNKLHKKLDTQKMKEPSFKMVLVGVGDYAYKRNDGILIVPIGCLKN